MPGGPGSGTTTGGGNVPTEGGTSPLEEQYSLIVGRGIIFLPPFLELGVFAELGVFCWVAHFWLAVCFAPPALFLLPCW